MNIQKRVIVLAVLALNLIPLSTTAQELKPAIPRQWESPSQTETVSTVESQLKSATSAASPATTPMPTPMPTSIPITLPQHPVVVNAAQPPTNSAQSTVNDEPWTYKRLGKTGAKKTRTFFKRCAPTAENLVLNWEWTKKTVRDSVPYLNAGAAASGIGYNINNFNLKQRI